MKNLTAGEMYDQVEMIATIARERSKIQPIKHCLYGMGEPLLNYKNVLESVKEFVGHPVLVFRQEE